MNVQLPGEPAERHPIVQVDARLPPAQSDQPIQGTAIE
jgi:hypothetical protein